MKRIGLLIVMLVVAGLVPIVHAEGYVAMVMDVDDKAVQFTDGGPVEVMTFFAEHDEVQVEDGGKVVIMFFESSMREEIMGPAIVTIGINGCESLSDLSTHIRRQSVEYLPPKAQVDKNHHQNFGNIAFRRLGKSLDVETQLVITSISNTVYAPGTQPLLTWKVYPRAEFFALTVRGDHGVDTLKTKSAKLGVTNKMQRAGHYTWILEAKYDGDVVASREGWYTIMTDNTYDEMKKSREMILEDYPANSVQRLAVLSMLYQSYEMWDEMSLVLLAMSKKQPGNTEVIRKIRSINPFLLETVQH